MFFPIASAPRPALAISAFALLLTALGITGCGGGGAGSAPPVTTSASAQAGSSATGVVTPTVVTPVIPPVSTQAPRDRAIAAGFAPNYLWTPGAGTPLLHWTNNKAIRVFIRPSVNNVRDNVPTATVDAAHARGYVDQALANWNTVTGGDFVFQYVDQASNADIEIVFVDKLLRSDFSEIAGVGLTNYNYSNPDATDPGHGVMTKAVSQVSTGQGDAGRVDVATHEMGHALGVILHSSDPADLMYTLSSPPGTITTRDQNTLFYLYYSPAAQTKATRVSDAGRAAASPHTGEVVCTPGDL